MLRPPRGRVSSSDTWSGCGNAAVPEVEATRNPHTGPIRRSATWSKAIPPVSDCKPSDLPSRPRLGRRRGQRLRFRTLRGDRHRGPTARDRRRNCQSPPPRRRLTRVTLLHLPRHPSMPASRQPRLRLTRSSARLVAPLSHWAGMPHPGHRAREAECQVPSPGLAHRHE